VFFCALCKESEMLSWARRGSGGLSVVVSKEGRLRGY